MKILIKGAGDLATGIACRLKNSGYDILMTEIAIPTTVRRTVAFSRAVYEQKVIVEGICGILAKNQEEVLQIQQDGNIAVLVDEEAKCKEQYNPSVLVDSILAKRNLGTQITDAPLVIGVGPGFCAREDCHCVVETKRGHYLGKVIYDGSAIPNTGIPGNIGGYTTERIIRATGMGIFKPKVEIGAVVEEGQLVATVESTTMERVVYHVYAQMPGIVRGMLQAEVSVFPNMKCGDIDGRCEIEHCFTISDKARAIGGGALEAIAKFEHKNN